ncbi:hypothetical protein MMC11_006544 [Xylographa trunciseda]|nr:hypothetical protein [Xylographa trunciseda]
MAKSLATVGILSIGDMGLGIAKLLIANKYRVITNVSDRSQDTHRRARSASVELVPTDAALVEQADYILSIVPPRDAFSIASRIEAASRSAQRQQSKPLYFLDLNAISPATSKTIAARFSSTPTIRLLDGGIIGGPPKLTDPSDAATCTYKPSIVVSGPHSLHEASEGGQHLAQLLNMKHISAEIGPASGLKMCFAAMSKGFTAIAIESFTTAERMGVLPELQAHLAEYNPSAGASAARGLVGMPPKAYRWVAEMEEIARTMEEFGGFRSRRSGGDGDAVEDGERGGGNKKSEEGRGGDLFRGVSDVYRFVADETRLGQEKTESRQRGMTAEDVAALCAEAMIDH